MDYRTQTDSKTGQRFLPVPCRGRDLLRNPLLNKGTAFSADERNTLGLRGLVPPVVADITRQSERVYANFQRQPTDLDRYIFLCSVQDRNETLFYHLLLGHLEEMVPIIYTPTVAEGCRRFSRLYRRARGLFISLQDRGHIAEVLRHHTDRPDIIVATDNERILGIGDQGAGGMGIPVGKLSLYVVTAGFHPGRCLPICLDVGTNNQELLADPLYVGLREPRCRGEAYHSFIEEFVNAVMEVWPETLLQWEDFGKTTAMVHLNKYRNRLPTFNDDIQGTAAVVDAGLRAAADHVGKRLTDLRIVMHGAGSAGIGCAMQIEEAMVRAGLPRKEAHARFTVLDSEGVVFADRGHLSDEKTIYAVPADRFAGRCERDQKGQVHLEDLCAHVDFDVLIGVSGQAGVFHESLVRDVAKRCERPVIMPLSNPTANAEATPANLMRWTDGRAVVATGSPFPDVEVHGRKVPVGQGNNMFIFPGVGLATVLSKARTVTMRMFLASADALRANLPAARLDAGTLYPDIRDARKVAAAVAHAVVEAAVAEGVAAKGTPTGDALARAIADAMWAPEYVPYRPA